MKKICKTIVFLIAAVFAVAALSTAALACGSRYTVTFDANGGSAVAAVTVDAGGSIDEPGRPTKEGNAFSGWFDNKNLDGSAVKFPYTPTGDVKLYAKWTPGSVPENNLPATGTADLTYDMLADFSQGESKLFEKADGWTNAGPFNAWWNKNNINIVDDALEIKITENPTGSVTACNEFYAGEYRTKQFYSYGDFAIKMKPAAEVGMASTFFTYTGPYDGDPHDEIDIEFLGSDTTHVQFNYFIDGSTGNEFLYDLGFDASKEYHEYGFRWEKNRITWFVDGKPVYKVDEAPTTPMKIMLNTWTGSDIAWGWMGKYAGVTENSRSSYKYVGTSAEPTTELPGGEYPVDPAPDATPVALSFSGNEIYTVTPGPDDLSTTITYNGNTSEYKNVGAAVGNKADGKDVFVTKIKNNGASTPSLRINVEGTKKVGNATAINQFATMNGELVPTDLVWGGSTFDIPAKSEIIAAVYFDPTTEAGPATKIEFMLDSNRAADPSFTATGDLTFSEFRFAFTDSFADEGGEGGGESDTIVYGDPVTLTFTTEQTAYAIENGTSANVVYTDVPMSAYSPISAMVGAEAAGATRFKAKIKNNSAATVTNVRLDILAEGGTKLVKSATIDGESASVVDGGIFNDIAAGAEVEVEVVFEGVAHEVQFFIDSYFWDRPDTTASGNITLSNFVFGSVQ